MDDAHPHFDESSECGISLLAIIDDTWNNDGGGAILEEINLLRQSLVLNSNITQEVAAGPGCAEPPG